MSIPDRVAAGAAWLDHHYPGWEDKIDLGRLVMSSCRRCVLGQLTGNYTNIVDAWNSHDPEKHLTLEDADQMGFSVNLWRCDSLSDEWRRVITERRQRAMAEIGGRA